MKKQPVPHWEACQLKPLVLVNLSANMGNGKKRWERLSSTLEGMLPAGTEYVCYEPPFALEGILKQHLIGKGGNCIISAGGDGTVHYILNTLMGIPNIASENLFLGGIGLGSSNDFLKPAGTAADKVLVRINPDKSVLADVGQVYFHQANGAEATRFFIVNASMGVTAQANLFFNRGDSLLRFLKARSASLAIVYAAVKTILSFRNIPATLRAWRDPEMPAKEWHFPLSNLAILKNPHISGNFTYDQNILPDDGWLGLNYCREMSTWQLLQVLRDLSGGQFSGKHQRHSLKVKALEVLPEQPAALEMDGEVLEVTKARFSLSERKINLLG